MSALGSSVCAPSVTSRAFASRPAKQQPSIGPNMPASSAFTHPCYNSSLRCSSIVRADSARRRGSRYDRARDENRRPMYNEAMLNEMETEYDLPSSRSNGAAQASSRTGQPPPPTRPSQPPGYTGTAAPYAEDRSTRGDRNRSYVPDGVPDYQEAPGAYALQRAPEPTMQLSFVEALKGKAVISAAEGARLGVAEGAILDSSAMTLEAITLSDTVAPTARGEPPFCVPTATLTQVGDVILVAEERAMRRPPAVAEFVPVLGLHVRTARGVYIGRVKDVDFEPETGAVTAVFYDEYGLASLPQAFFNLFGIPTDAVLSVTREAVVIDTRFTWLAAPGRFEPIGQVLKSLKVVGRQDDTTAAVGARQARSVAAWEAQYGMTAEEWVERYGGEYGARDARPALTRGRAPDPRRRPSQGMEAAGPPPGAPTAQGRDRGPTPSRQPPAEVRPAPQQGEYWDDEGDEWAPPAQRPTFGDILQRDGRSLQFDEVQAPLPSKRRGDVMRGEDAF